MSPSKKRKTTEGTTKNDVPTETVEAKIGSSNSNGGEADVIGEKSQSTLYLDNSTGTNNDKCSNEKKKKTFVAQIKTDNLASATPVAAHVPALPMSVAPPLPTTGNTTAFPNTSMRMVFGSAGPQTMMMNMLQQQQPVVPVPRPAPTANMVAPLPPPPVVVPPPPVAATSLPPVATIPTSSSSSNSTPVLQQTNASRLESYLKRLAASSKDDSNMFVSQVNLSQFRPTAKDLKELVSILPTLSNLTRLHLSDCGIGDEGVKILVKAQPLPKLETLWLDGNNISSVGAKLLADSWLSPANLPQLKRLFMPFNKMGPQGALVVSQCVPFLNKLEAMDVGENEIGNQGAAVFGSMLASNNNNSYSYLKELYLYGNNIGDDGAEALATGLKNSRLEELDLRYNTIEDDGAQALASCLKKHNRSLRSLVMVGNPINPPAKGCLASAKPRELTVTFYRGDMLM